MRTPSVVIIANPYEGELIGRALAETGLRVLRADGGEGAHALLATELPIAAVVASSLLAADPVALIAEARARHHGISLFLLAEAEDAVAAELATRVTRVFPRPTDLEALAAAIERVAVDVERAELEGYEVVGADPALGAPPPPPIPRIRTAPLLELAAEAGPGMASRGAASRVPGGEAVPQAPLNGDTARTLLRADEALGDALDLHDVTDAGRRHPRAFESRSTIAREIDRELSRAERRLFPDGASTPSAFPHVDDYDDALSDIDLDALAIDTVPGSVVPAEPVPARAVERASPPPSARPVQEEGALDRTDVAELLGRLHAAAFSGALHVRRPEGDRVVYLEQGEVIAARSTLRHEHLAELLFREGALTREHATRARAADVGGDGAARAVALRLIDEGLIKESEVFAVVRRHVEEIAYALFALESGGYALGPELPAAEDRARLAPAWALIFEGVRRKYSLERLLRCLGGRAAVSRPTTLFAEVVEAAGLSAEERRAAAVFDGARSIADARAEGGREALLAAVAWSLRACGALDAGAGEAADLRYASTVVTGDGAERRARPRVVDPEQERAERAVERERIASKRAQVLDADYFGVLGVARDASPHELRRAHDRLRTEFRADRFSPEVAAEHGPALAEIAEVLDEALRVLLTAPVRARYAARLLPLDETDA